MVKKREKESKMVGFIISLIGLIMVITFTGLGIILSILGLYFSNRERKVNPTGFSKAGFVMGIIGIVLHVLTIILLIIVFFAFMNVAGTYNIIYVETSIPYERINSHNFLTGHESDLHYAFTINFFSDNPCSLDLLKVDDGESILLKQYPENISINKRFLTKDIIKEGFIRVNCSDYPTNYKLNVTLTSSGL